MSQHAAHLKKKKIKFIIKKKKNLKKNTIKIIAISFNQQIKLIGQLYFKFCV